MGEGLDGRSKNANGKVTSLQLVSNYLNMPIDVMRSPNKASIVIKLLSPLTHMSTVLYIPYFFRL